MDNLRKISLIIGISAVVLALGGAIYFTYLIYEIRDFRVIEKFSASDPKFHTDNTSTLSLGGSKLCILCTVGFIVE